MKFPEKGTMVKVKWFDAFSYNSSKELEIEKNCVNISTGEWFGIYETEKDGKTIEYADIRHEKSNGGTHDGLRIPSGWIISIEEYEPKKCDDRIFKDRDPHHIEMKWSLNQCN